MRLRWRGLIIVPTHVEWVLVDLCVQDGSDSDDAAVAVEFKSRRVTGALPRIQLDKNHNVLPPA